MKHGKLKKSVKIFLSVLIVVVVLCTGIFHYYTSLFGGFSKGSADQNSEFAGTSEMDSELKSQLEALQKDSSLSGYSIENILVVGVDSRTPENIGNSDSMMLFSIDRRNKRIVRTSLLRDCYVEIPGYPNGRLNHAFEVGGAELLAETIHRNFNIEIDRTVAVNFWLVRDLIDEIGGLDIEMSLDEIKVANDYIRDQNNEMFQQAAYADKITAVPGVVHCNGNQALAYARNRYTGTDFARAARQRNVTDLVLKKLKTMSLFQLNHLATTFLPRISTDLNSADIANLLLVLLDYGNYNVRNLALPVAGTYENATIDGASVLKVNYGENYAAYVEALTKENQTEDTQEDVNDIVEQYS